MQLPKTMKNNAKFRRVLVFAAVVVSPWCSFVVQAQNNTSAAQASKQSDSQIWRNANSEVGRFQRGHIDVLKTERGRAASNSPLYTSAFKENSAAPELTEETARKTVLSLHADLLSSLAISHPEKYLRDMQLISLLQSTQKLWIEAVAAKEIYSIQMRLTDAAYVALELAKRMEKVGNWSRSKLVDVEISYQTARNQLLLADQVAFNSREKLVKQLGSDQWRLPNNLPKPINKNGLSELSVSVEQQQSELLARHPQFLLIEKEAQYFEKIVGPEMLSAWRQQIDHIVNASTSWTSTLPLFDRTKIIWNHDLDKAIKARAEVAKMRLQTKTDLQQAREYLRASHTQATDILSGLQKLYVSAEEEAKMRYNGMFISTWELIAKAQAKLQAELAVVQATQSFWIALTDMRGLLAGAPYNGPGGSASGPDNSSYSAKGH